METRLKDAAIAFQRAPVELRDAIVEAGKEGATNVEIAQAINFAYSPDYIGRLIAKAAGPRKPGRRPKPPEDR